MAQQNQGEDQWTRKWVGRNIKKNVAGDRLTITLHDSVECGCGVCTVKVKDKVQSTKTKKLKRSADFYF